MSRKYLFALLVAAVGMLGVVPGCKDDDSSTGPSGNIANSSSVMVIHASPDAPAVDLYLDGTKVASNVSYLMNTNYIQVAAGIHRVDITLPGQTEVVYSDTGMVEAGQSYSLFAGGLVSDQSFSFYGFQDSLMTPPTGTALVRILHMSPDAPAVDIAVNGEVVLQSLSFSQITEWLSADPGTYTLEIRAAGSSTALATVSNVGIAAGKVYTIYARGLANGTPALGASIIVNR